VTVVLGLGARPGLPVDRLRAAALAVLGEAGLTAADVAVLATVDRRAAEDGVRSLALDLGWRLVGLPVADLAAQTVPNPSARVAGAMGTGSVAEAAALVAAGPGATLLIAKRVLDGVTVAVASASRSLRADVQQAGARDRLPGRPRNT
jgi:cobalt-precorrin 5A hydrolase